MLIKHGKKSISKRAIIGFDHGLPCRVKNMALGPQLRQKPRPSASVFVYWVPRAMFFTRHGRPWSNPTPRGIAGWLRKWPKWAIGSSSAAIPGTEYEYLTCPEKSRQRADLMISRHVRVKKRHGIQCPENMGPPSTCLWHWPFSDIQCCWDHYGWHKQIKCSIYESIPPWPPAAEGLCCSQE